MKKLLISIILSVTLIAPLWASKKVRLHTLGDSTMEQQNPNLKDQRGWVQLLQSFLKDDLEVMDHAKSGTSTKTFYRQGYWDRAKKTIQPGDYVLIQFGHNDEKHNGKDGPIGTAPTDSFRIYLAKYVNEVRSLGAHPILVTPVVRNMFGLDGKLSRRGKHDLGEYVHNNDNPAFNLNDTITFNYPYNIRYEAKELNCPLIDMTLLSARLVEPLGNSKATSLIYNLGDGTHFGTTGAVLFSQLFVKELQHQQILTEYLRPPKHLITNPSNIGFTNLFKGTESVQIFDVCYLGDTAKNMLSLTASEGFSLSIKPDKYFTDHVNLPRSSPDGVTVFKMYVKTMPLQAGAITGIIKVTANGETNIITISGDCQEMKNNQPISVVYDLNTNAMPGSTGPVTALTEVWNGMELINYGIPTLSNGKADSTLANKKVQQNTIIGKIWPKNEEDVVYSRYIQFRIKASHVSDLIINSIEFYAGGGSNFRVVTSQTEDFSSTVTVGEDINVKGDEMMNYSFKTSQKVDAGKTLYIRIYPWGNKSCNYSVTKCNCLFEKEYI